MFKKIYFVSTLSLISLSAMAMVSPDAYVSNLTAQLNHVNAQINAAKRAWKESLLRIALATKASPALYTQVKPILEKIITSPAFITRMNTTVEQQMTNIVNGYASFKDVKIENNIADFSSKPMPSFAQQLYTAMANKAYYYLLGQQLAQKSKDLATTIRTAQQTPANDQPNFFMSF